MATVERTLTINVRKQVMMVPAYRRAKKAVTVVREFLQQHMKSDNVKLGKYLNLKIWEHGIKNPIQRVTVVAKKDDKGIVTAELPNIPVKKHNEKRLKAKVAHKEQPKEQKQAETKKADAAPAAVATAAAVHAPRRCRRALVRAPVTAPGRTPTAPPGRPRPGRP